MKPLPPHKWPEERRLKMIMSTFFLVVLVWIIQANHAALDAPKLFGVAFDPAVDISVLNIHSHPLEGEYWDIDFTTRGTGDLTITPADRSTVDEDEFTALFCGDEDRTKGAELLPGDVIYYPNWQCNDVATVSHLTLATGKHHVYLQFGGTEERAIAEAFNASIAWDGGGVDANWNNGDNWVGNVAPGVNDLAVFDGTACAANCNPTINVSISVQGISMTVAHTITQTNGTTVTIGSAGYTQSAGTFTGGNATSHMDINDAGFDLSGGNFTAPGGNMSIERNFTKSGAPVFTHNSGTIILDDADSSDDTTFDCGGIALNKVTITKDNTGDIVISSGCTVPLGANPVTVTENAIFTNNGTITVSSGTWTHTDTNGNPNAGNILTNNGTITHNGDGWTFGIGFVNGAAGVVTYAGATTSFAGPLNVSQGTFPNGLGVNFIDDNAGDDTTLTCGAVTFNYVTITKNNTGDMIISSGCTVPLGANPVTVTENAIFTNGGTITVSSGTWTHTDTNANPNAGNILTNNGTITHNGNGWTFGIGLVNGASGVVTYAGATTSFAGPLNVSQGTFPNGLGVNFIDDNAGDDTTLTCGAVTFNYVTITKDNTGEMIISSGCTVPLGANPTTVTNNAIFTNNGTVTVSAGTWTHTDTNANPNAGNIFTNNGTTTHNGNGWTFGIGFVNGAAGVVTYAGATTSFAGPLDVSQGTFPSGLGVNFIDDNDGDDTTLTCGAVTFNYVTINKDNTGSMIISSGCTVPLGASPTTVTNNAIFTNNGTITVSSGTWTHTDTNGNPNAGNILTNNGTTTHNGNGWTFGIGFVNGASGVVTYAGATTSFAGPLNVSQGTFPSGLAVDFIDDNSGDSTTLTCGAVTFSNITITKDSTGAMILGDSCTGTGNFTFGAGTVSNPASAMTLIVQGNSTLSSAGTFGGANLTLSLEGGTSTTLSKTAGTFASKLKVNKSVGSSVTLTTALVTTNTFEIASGTFSQGATFDFTTGGATTVGINGTWSNLGTGDVTLGGDVTNAGTITLNANGATCGDADSIVLSDAGVTQRTWSGAGTFTLQDLNVSDMAGAMTTQSSTNTANNTGWTFSACNQSPDAPSALGPASLVGGGTGSDNTPDLTFTLTDPDGADTLKYNIQIDDSADFASLVVEYISALAAQGARTFTVGQAAGTGAYITGSAGQTLADSSTGYYWRVRATDNLNATGSFATANGGAVAFKIDTVVPSSGRDTAPPTASSFNPVNGATGVSPTTTLRMTMSESVNKFSGNIFIKRTSDNSIAETVDVSQSHVVVSGSLVTITLTNPLSYTTGYYIEVPGGAFADTAGNSFPGFAGSATWSFTVASAAAPTSPTATSTPVATTTATSTPPKDTTPPANPINFSGISGIMQVALSWTNPVDADFAAVRVVRMTSTFPKAPTDGILIYEGKGTTTDDTDLAPKTLYYYAAFARDGVPNYSSGVFFSVTTEKKNIPPPLPTPPPPPAPPVLPPVLPPPAPMDVPPAPSWGGSDSFTAPPLATPPPAATPAEHIPDPEKGTTTVATPPPTRLFFSFASSTFFSPAILEAMSDLVENVREPIADAAPVASTVGVAVGVSQAIVLTTHVSSAYDLYLLLLKFIGLITGLFRKKRSEPWGVVYDSVTKRPLDPAYVIAQIEGGSQSKGEAITDLDGRYGFLLNPGEYHIVANKTHYKFPSEKLKGVTRDELYENLYYGEPFDVTEGGVVQYNIPLDPIEFDWNEFAKNQDKVFQVYSKKQNIRRWIFNVMFYLGFLFSAATLFFTPSLLNSGVVATYVIILAFQIFWRSTHEVTRVVDKATGKTLPFALIKVWYPHVHTIAKKVVTDEIGRFYLLIPPGSYYLTVEAKQPDGSYKEVLKTGEMELGQGVIKGDLLV